jgi:hypothetical protein
MDVTLPHDNGLAPNVAGHREREEAKQPNEAKEVQKNAREPDLPEPTSAVAKKTLKPKGRRISELLLLQQSIATAKWTDSSAVQALEEPIIVINGDTYNEGCGVDGSGSRCITRNSQPSSPVRRRTPRLARVERNVAANLFMSTRGKRKVMNQSVCDGPGYSMRRSPAVKSAAREEVKVQGNEVLEVPVYPAPNALLQRKRARRSKMELAAVITGTSSETQVPTSKKRKEKEEKRTDKVRQGLNRRCRVQPGDDRNGGDDTDALTAILTGHASKRLADFDSPDLDDDDDYIDSRAMTPYLRRVLSRSQLATSRAASGDLPSENEGGGSVLASPPSTSYSPEKKIPPRLHKFDLGVDAARSSPRVDSSALNAYTGMTTPSPNSAESNPAPPHKGCGAGKGSSQEGREEASIATVSEY